jgi:urease accessory protein
MMDRCIHPGVYNDPLSGRRGRSAAASASIGSSADRPAAAADGVEADGRGGLVRNRISASADRPAAAADGVEADGRGGLVRNRISASAEIVAVAGIGGATRLPVLASQAPLVLRRTPDAVYVVGGAAGPIGGDELALRISVGAGAFLRVRTAAASIALPGPEGLESVLRITVDVGAGARLEYLPEPVVVSAGARHATIIRVTLAEGASLLLRDELLLGRHGETGGAARSVLNVDYAGRPLLRQSLEVSGADAVVMGPAVLAGHRAVGTALWVDPAAGEARVADAAAGEARDADAAAGEARDADAAAGEARDADAAEVGDSDAGGERAEAGWAISADAAATTDAALRTDAVFPADAAVAVMPLAGPGILVTALANDAVALRRCLSATPSTRTPTCQLRHRPQ